jgi:Mn2+/Fe2+ NRAMP family transporter
MKSLYYYGATIIYFIIILFGACYITSVSKIFNFVSAIAINCLSFLFPSTFYFMAKKKYEVKNENYWEISAYLNAILGIAAVIIGLYNSIEEII